VEVDTALAAISDLSLFLLGFLVPFLDVLALLPPDENAISAWLPL